MNKVIRWSLLSASLIAILTLTAMNVYMLYDVRDTLIQGEQKKQLALLDEVALNVRRTIYRPYSCLLYTSPSPRDKCRSRMPSSA